MDLAEVREMSAPLIGAGGNLSPACQAVVIHYWHRRGKELRTAQDSSHQRLCSDLKGCYQDENYLAWFPGVLSIHSPLSTSGKFLSAIPLYLHGETGLWCVSVFCQFHC